MKRIRLLCLAACAAAFWMAPFGATAEGATPDWSTVSDVHEVHVLTTNQDGSLRETTIWFTSVAGQAFIRTSASTTWGDNVERNPDISLRIEKVEYPFHAVFITDAATRAAVVAAFRAKYGWPDRLLGFMRGSTPRIMRLDPRAPGAN